jgi:hypothetical protein
MTQGPQKPSPASALPVPEITGSNTEAKTSRDVKKSIGFVPKNKEFRTIIMKIIDSHLPQSDPIRNIGTHKRNNNPAVKYLDCKVLLEKITLGRDGETFTARKNNPVAQNAKTIVAIAELRKVENAIASETPISPKKTNGVQSPLIPRVKASWQ